MKKIVTLAVLGLLVAACDKPAPAPVEAAKVEAPAADAAPATVVEAPAATPAESTAPAAK